MRQTVPAYFPLFRSESQLRVLGLIVLEPRRSWTVDQLAEASAAPRPSVHRELQRALAAGLIERDASRRPHRFRASTKSALYRPLRDLLKMTVGVEPELRRLLQAEDEVDAAVIHGSWARGEAAAGSDIDVLVIGRPNVTRLRRSVRDVGRRVGRRIDTTVFSPDEFRRRRARGDGFLKKIDSEPHIELVGSLDGLSP